MEKIKDWEDYSYPKGYRIDKGQLICETLPKDNYVCDTPYILCGKTNEIRDGCRLYLVRYEFDGEQKEFLARADQLLRKNKCAEIFTGHAFKVNDNKKFGRVLEYNTRFMTQFDGVLPLIEATDQNGWNKDFTMFAIGKRGIFIDEVRPIYTAVENPLHVDIFEERGSEKIWVEAMNELIGFDLVRFLFYDSMTAPLLKVLGLEGHSFEHCGKTSSGKTTISYLIASAIGEPVGQRITPASSEKGIVSHVEQMNDLPTFVDEITSKANRQVAKAAIYDITNGVQKARAKIDGKLRDDIKRFSAVTHFTCEGTIKDDLDHAGEMYRLNSMNEMLPYLDWIWRIEETIKMNYGFFISKYVQKIMQSTEIKDRYLEFMNELKATTGILNRSRRLYACIMLAGYICEEVFREMGITEGDYKGVVLKYWEECVIMNNVEHDYVRALRLVNEWVAINESRFVGSANGLPDKKYDPVGMKSGELIHIAGIPFTKLMKENGYVTSNILSEWEKTGITKTMPSLKGKFSFPLGGVLTKGVCIRVKEMEKIL